MAHRGGGAAVLLAARRRGTRRGLRRVLAARGLSGAARRTPRRRGDVPCRRRTVCPHPPGAWRVRRLHGARRGARRRRRREARDARAARPCDQFRETPPASRLSACDAYLGRRARPCRGRAARARVPLREPDRAGQRRPVGAVDRRRGARPRPCRGATGDGQRLLLPRGCNGNMMFDTFDTFDALDRACRDLPSGEDAAADAVRARQDTLTKPPRSLGRLEELCAWLARWQGRPEPSLARVQVLVFAGNHGVVARGVSPYPPEVTRQMVANFIAGGAAINQLAGIARAALRVVPLDLDAPTADITTAAAMSEQAFVSAVAAGYDSVGDCDLVALGEMGIGNTTAAACLAAALFGGDGARWAGRGTGVDDAGLGRKRAVVDAALARHAGVRGDPLRAAMALGGRELAAILGAALAARQRRIPVLLDGFVCTAAAAPGHRAMIAELGQRPLLDLDMRLGEASGATLAILLLRAALACHTGMATFAEAGVRDRNG